MNSVEKKNDCIKTYADPSISMANTAAFLRHRMFNLYTIQKAIERVATSRMMLKTECAHEMALKLPH